MKLTFSFWGSYLDLEMWRNVIDRFQEEHPEVTIDPEYSPGDYAQKLRLRLISNTASDLILMDDESFPGYSERGYLVDLAALLERDAEDLNLDDFLPTSLESFNFRGVQGGMPWGGFPVLMFYNKDMFDAAGVPYPEDDWTWEDFRVIARKLTRDTDGNGVPDEFGANVGFGFLDMEPVIWGFGGDILNEDSTRAVIDSPEALEALQFIYDIKFEDHSTAWMGESEGMAKEVELLTGKVGMVMSGWYLARQLMDIKGGMRWGIAPMPSGPRGDRYTRVSWDGISINNAISDEKKAMCWEFLKFLLREDTQAFIAELGRSVPVHRTVAEEHFVQPETPVQEELALEGIDYGKLTPVTAKYDQLKNAIQRPFKEVEIGLKTPEEAVKLAEQDANAVLQAELERWLLSQGGVPKENPAAKRAFSIGIGVFLAGLAVLLVLLRKRIFRRLSLARQEYGGNMARNEAFHGYLFALPWFTGFMIFMAYPFLFSIVLSLSSWDPYDPVSQRTFVGFENFRQALFHDPLIWKALWNTFYFAGFAIPLSLGLSLGLAMLLNTKVKGIGIYRTIFYIPSIVGGVATAVIWAYIFNPTFGPLTNLIRSMNGVLANFTAARLPEIQWIADPAMAKPSLILMSLWGAGGGGMLIFLAGLQGIPDTYYEAADIDGASRMRKFWNITLPLLTPTIYFNLIIGMVNGLQVFMEAFVMVGKDGGIDNSLLFYMLYLYRTAFIEYRMGYASAMAWILFAIILVLTLFVARWSALWVYYEGEKKR
jgi:multiple sugar transport system permease protein